MANGTGSKCRSFSAARLKSACFCFAVLVVAAMTFLSTRLPFGRGASTASSVGDADRSPDEAAAALSNETIPKIIHQVWLGYDQKRPPPAWRNATEQSIRKNPDFGYRLWSNSDVIELLTSHYGWFLPTYRRYPYDVERADAARYFIILHHGGVYLDMDEVSVVPISDIIAADRLQRYQCVLPQGTPNGVTNYVIMCKRNSPFMAYLTSRLTSSDGWYGIPYATVMWSTGPRFISAVYDSYIDKESLFVMQAAEVTKNFRCLFGQSWFSLDGVIIHVIFYPFIRLGISWYHLITVVVLIAVLIALLIWRRMNHASSLPRTESQV